MSKDAELTPTEAHEPCLRCDRWGRRGEMVPLWSQHEANGEPTLWVHKRCEARHRYSQVVLQLLGLEWARDWARAQPIVSIESLRPIENLRGRAGRGRWTITLQQFRAVGEREEELIEKGLHSAEQANATWVWPPEIQSRDAG